MHQRRLMIWLLIILSVKSLRGLEIVSRNKPAHQISDAIHYGITRVAGLAVDGNTNPDYYGANSCCSTVSTSGPNPWWYVDLQNIYSVSKVDVYKSTTSRFGKRVEDIEIRVGYDKVPPFSGNTICGSTITEDMVLNNNHVTMTCSQAIPGQYVTLYRTVDHDIDVLTLCEVKVYADTEVPIVTCPDDVSVSTDLGQSTATVTWSDLTVTDNVDNNLPVTCTIDSSPIDTNGSSFVIGETTVDCQSTDNDSNTASCSFSVVISDTEAPVFTCPDDVSKGTDSGQPTATVTWSNPTATDNVDTNPLVLCAVGSSYIYRPTRGSSFAIGETTVDCHSTDNAGNTDYCSFSVDISDTGAPVVTCPDDVSVGTDPGQSTANVTWSDPTVTDDVDTNLRVTCTTGSGPIDIHGSSFAIGETIIDCQSTDNNGTTGSCSFSIVTSDTEAPVVTCPDDVSVGTNPGQSTATVTWSDPTVTDNVDTNLPVTCAIGSSPIDIRGSSFVIGETTVDCQSTDNACNAGSCSFSVIISGNSNATSLPGYLIAVVVILCVIILVMSPALIFFCRLKRIEHSTGMNMTDYDDVVLPKTTTNAQCDTEYEIPMTTIGDVEAAAPPKLESQRRVDSTYEDPHTYMSVDPTYTDLKK